MNQAISSANPSAKSGRHSAARSEATLARLADVALPTECEVAIEELRLRSQGSVVWRSRKAAEARDLFALAQIAPRLTVLALEGATELRALVRLGSLVPCLAEGETDLAIERVVDLVLHYPEEILLRPLPGYALVEILRPRHVLLPNVSYGSPQLLCLGANVSRNYPLREAVLASYAALTMQAVTIDERDTAGVMNPAAARWWQANTHRIPLSTEPFLGTCRETPEPSSKFETTDSKDNRAVSASAEDDRGGTP